MVPLPTDVPTPQCLARLGIHAARGRSGPASKYMSPPPRDLDASAAVPGSSGHTRTRGQQKRGSSIPQGPQAGCGGRVAPRAGPGGWAAPRAIPGRVEQGSHCPHPELMARNPAGHPQVSSGHAEAAECCGETAQWGPACPQLPAASVVLLPRRAAATATGTRLTSSPGCCPTSWVFII